MGIVIFTADDSKYRVGDYIVMFGEMTYPPTASDTTYILHSTRFKEADAIKWAAIVPYRLVIVTKKLPPLSDKSKRVVIVDENLRFKRNDYNIQIEAVLRWRDRERALIESRKIPIPLTLSFLRRNIHDIDLWRMLAKSSFTLPDEYIHAILAWFIQPMKGVTRWPKKKQAGIELPSGIRESDVYAEQIANLSRHVANEIRVKEPTRLPKGIKKGYEGGLEWI